MRMIICVREYNVNAYVLVRVYVKLCVLICLDVCESVNANAGLTNTFIVERE